MVPRPGTEKPPARPAHSALTGPGSQRDHDLAVEVAPGLQRHGVADLLDREDRRDGHGDLAGEDRVGDPLQGIRPRVDAGALAMKLAYDRWIDTANGEEFSEIARRTLRELQAASALC